MDKKYLKIISTLIVFSILVGCAKESEYTIINGEKLKSSVVNSGYYFDKASLSEIQIKDMIDRIKTIPKPENMGSVEFESNIENIELNATTPEEVTETEIEAAIESIRDIHREEKIVTSKRGVQLGDKVVMNFTGKVDGVEFMGGTGIDQELEIGNGSLLPEFEKGILNKVPGKTFAVGVTIPADFQEESLRGRRAIYSCIIKYIKEKVTPEFDDEFAKKYSKNNATTSDEYRKEIAEEIKFRKSYDIQERLRNELFSKIYEISKCTPSEESLAWQWTKIITEQKRLADLRSVSIEEQMTNGYYALNDVLSSYKLQCQEIVKTPMILDELSRKYNITYTDEDKMQWFKDICIYKDYGLDVTYKLYSNSMGEPYIYDNGRLTKVMDEVLKHVKITYEELNAEEVNK